MLLYMVLLGSFVQIQHLLKLNKLNEPTKEEKEFSSNTTLVKVKFII